MFAQHLRDIEATRIRNGEPRRSIRLHFRYDPAFRYIIFGKEGYVSQIDRFEGEEFPSFGWRIDRRHLLQPHQGGDEASDQRSDHHEGPDGVNAPTDGDGANVTAPDHIQGRTTAHGHVENDGLQRDEQSNDSNSSVTYTGDSDDDTGGPATPLEDSDEHYLDSDAHYTPREDDNSSRTNTNGHK
jgi:hypothetical protein